MFFDHIRMIFRLPLNEGTEPIHAEELATGPGKSLDGHLMAERRRQAHGARVAYLCPTLAHDRGRR